MKESPLHNMQEAFDDILDKDGLIPADELAELRRRADGPSLRRLSAHALALAAAVGWVVAAHGSEWVVPATVLLAALLASVFAPFHESTHQTAFVSARLNRRVALITGIVIGLSAAGYRGFHLAHHRYTQDPERDPEILIEPEMAWWPPTVPRWLRMITHGDILTGKIKMMSGAWLQPSSLPLSAGTGDPEAHVARRSLTELRVAGALWFGLLVAGLFGVPGALAVVAAFVLSHLFLGLWLQTEHTGRGFDGSILKRARTVETPALVRFFLWNMNYHAEHHAWPAVPWYALPRVHDAVHMHIDAAPGYLTLHREVLSSVVAKGV